MVTGNLHGSGASVPQHFHARFLPFSPLLENLTQNIKQGRKQLNDPNDVISAVEIVSPFWGLKMSFRDDVAPHDRGIYFYSVVHKIRSQSQLKLSYNYYIDATNPQEVIVLFREATKESPFITNEVVNFVRQAYNNPRNNTVHLPPEAEINRTINKRWRWGWLESLGALPSRDRTFEDIDTFDQEFWHSVFDYMSLDSKYRKSIWNALRQQINKRCP